MKGERFGVTCLLTFKCNYRCPYCSQVKNKDWLLNQDINVEYWLNLFRSIPRAYISLTGGEPFLYSGFLDIIEEMPRNNLFQIATNLSAPLAKFLDVADPEQIVAFTASLHPLGSPKFSLKKFLHKLRILQEYGFPTFVNYVAYPQQIQRINFFKRQVEAIGCVFNVDPYISSTYIYAAGEEREVAEHLTARRKIGYRWEEENLEKYCSAGRDYIFVISNGETYRCLSGWEFHEKQEFYLGNITTKVKLNKVDEMCFNACPAVCDQSMVTIHDKDGNEISSPRQKNELLVLAANKLAKRRSLRRLWAILPRCKTLFT